ncbi:hypothetical protein HMPREF0660_00559 [Prevotella melaninogenica D18]|nr:hypothetical protein HMPREF0660_00559 [Prevotella melaninogenica D18]
MSLGKRLTEQPNLLRLPSLTPKEIIVMKHIKAMMFAIVMLMATPVFFTSCQEDAPEINYTMNVSVTNDFTKVVQAINEGFLKNEQAVDSLTKVIDKMNTSQEQKLKALYDILTSMNSTLEAKLAAVESAIKAQTLSLEAKMELLEKALKAQTLSLEAKMELLEKALKAQTLSFEKKMELLEKAIKALPDYSEKLEAIEAAIAALPNYGDQLTAIEAAIAAMPNYDAKFKAIVDALNLMKKEVEKVGTAQSNVSTELANTTSAINNLISAVNSGNTDAAKALAGIVKKLDELKEKIGTSGSGGSGGSGGSDSPDEKDIATFGSIVESIDKMNSKSFELHSGTFYFRTDEGRYGVAQVNGVRNIHVAGEKNRTIFVINFVVYNTNGKVHRRSFMNFDTYIGGAHVEVVRDLDFDNDLLGGLGVDFHLKVKSGSFHDGSFAYQKVNKAVFEPKNKARAVVFLKNPDE